MNVTRNEISAAFDQLDLLYIAKPRDVYQCGSA